MKRGIGKEIKEDRKELFSLRNRINELLVLAV
jgi:hypothetical protein